MKSIKTAGVLSALLAAVILLACLPARSAENTILYVRNQVYTQPTVRDSGDIYASLEGLLKALRFGWKVDGNSVSILPSGGTGAPLNSTNYIFFYRNRRVSIPSRIENGSTWVSARALAQAVGAGYQVNDALHIVEIYFASAAVASTPAPPPSPIAVAVAGPPTPAVTVSASPTVTASASPTVTASGSASPTATGTASPAAATATPTPAPTPQPDVTVTRNVVVADIPNGRLVTTIEVDNPADVPAFNVTAHVHLVSGEGADLGNQEVYFGQVAPRAHASQTVSQAHPDGTSMPRSLYQANTTITFTR